MIVVDSEDEIILFRSANIGDFFVVLPFINYLINILGVSENKISIVIINEKNVNPLKLVFNNDRSIVKNSTNLNSKNIFSDAKIIKGKYKKKYFTKVIYLPFTNEPLVSKIKKFFLIKYITGCTNKIYGLNLKKQNFNIGTQYLTYFEQIGLTPTMKYLMFDIDSIVGFIEKEQKKIDVFFLDTSKKHIALYINSKLKMKIWNDSEYHKVVLYLKEKYKAIIYLIGGTEDFQFNKQFIDKYKINDIKNIAGKLSIRETLLFLNKIDLLIGNDGSPIHMAAYCNCAILGIYTYKEEVSSWAPYKSNKFITYRKNVSCKHCHLEYCDRPICIENIKFEDISLSIDVLLKKIKIRQSIVIN